MKASLAVVGPYPVHTTTPSPRGGAAREDMARSAASSAVCAHRSSRRSAGAGKRARSASVTVCESPNIPAHPVRSAQSDLRGKRLAGPARPNDVIASRLIAPPRQEQGLRCRRQSPESRRRPPGGRVELSSWSGRGPAPSPVRESRVRRGSLLWPGNRG